MLYARQWLYKKSKDKLFFIFAKILVVDKDIIENKHILSSDIKILNYN